MTTMTLAPASTGQPGDNSYETGYLEGQLAAIDKTPSSIVLSRAATAERYAPLWAQGYDDGFIDQTNYNAARHEKQEQDR